MPLFSKTDVTKYGFSPRLPNWIWYDSFTVEVEGVEYLMTDDWADAASYWRTETDPDRDARIYARVIC